MVPNAASIARVKMTLFKLYVLICLSVFVTTINGQYIGSTFATSWYSANDYCLEHYNSTLATIRNEDEDSAVHAAGIAGVEASTETGYNTDRFYIGLNDIDDDNSWTWIDGTISSYTYNFIISGDGNCAERMYDQDQWNDLSCSEHERYFVCNLNENSNETS